MSACGCPLQDIRWSLLVLHLYQYLPPSHMNKHTHVQIKPTKKETKNERETCWRSLCHKHIFLTAAFARICLVYNCRCRITVYWRVERSERSQQLFSITPSNSDISEVFKHFVACRHASTSPHTVDRWTTDWMLVSVFKVPLFDSLPHCLVNRRVIFWLTYPKT